MANTPFNISASKQGNKGLIRIIGTIGLDTNADLFRSQVDSLVNDGITDVHLYINSGGGSCFDAAEIVNIIQSNFSGRITGEGGAIVASAATFIALHCNAFSMPENGMFMIHKPSGGKEGNAKDLESFTKLLKNIEEQYYNIYKGRVSDILQLDANWNNGDWWMTAIEAKENGFISDVKGQTIIDAQTTSLISAFGCPPNKLPKGYEDKANFSQIIEALDLEANADTKQILSAIAILKGEETPEMSVETALKLGCIHASERNEFLTIAHSTPKVFKDLMRKRKEQNRANIEAKIDNKINAAIFEKRILATAANEWKILFALDFDATSAAMAKLPAIQKVVFKNSSGNGKCVENRADWTLDDYRKKDPKALINNPELYKRLLDKEEIK